MPAHFFVYCVRIEFGHGSAVLSVHFSRIIARASVVSFSRIFALPFRLLSRMICGLFQTLSRAFLPPFKFFYCADCQSVFFSLRFSASHPAFFSAPPQTTIRLSFPFRHPFTSRRCTGELVPFLLVSPLIACSFFARIFPFSLLFHPSKFAYFKKK